MHLINHFLSQRLKSLRKEQGWSLDRTAKETGVSKAMLGQIERGESSPTIATLWKIAGGFHTSLSSFIDSNQDDEASPEIREADRLRHQPASDEMLVASLFPYEQQYGFELFELTLLPGYERFSDPHDKGVTEHVIVIKGEMELLVEGHWQLLKQGDAVRFSADKPHGYRNSSDHPTVFHNLIHYL
jgi:transcriptional regulator with XRE-family HTH domain